eukprot:5280823-Pyramimonas_sp.AAC.1
MSERPRGSRSPSTAGWFLTLLGSGEGPPRQRVRIFPQHVKHPNSSKGEEVYEGSWRKRHLQCIPRGAREMRGRVHLSAFVQ